MKKKNLDQQIAELKKQSQELEKAVAEVDAKNKAQEESKIIIAEETKSYNVFGRDFSVGEDVVVDYYKYRMKIMAIEYRLVGYVNDNGKYVVPNEIKYDLIDMKKGIEEMGDDFYKASALYMKKYFNFTIKLTMLDDGKAKASLEIAEYVGKNVDGEMIYTHIADFVDVYDDEYRIKLRKAFNLYDVEVKNDDFEIPNLAVLMQDLYDIDMFIGGLYDTASQIYLMRMLKLLESGGEKEKEIIERYSQLVELLEDEHDKDFEIIEIAGRKVYKQKDKYINEKRKECLDKAIDEKGGIEKLSVDKKARDLILEDANKTNEAIGNLKPGGTLEVEAPHKEESKGSSGSSSAGGKKKSGGANKSGGDKKGSEKKKSEKKKRDDKKKDDKEKGGSSGGGSTDTSKKDEINNGLNEALKKANAASLAALESAKASVEKGVGSFEDERKRIGAEEIAKETTGGTVLSVIDMIEDVTIAQQSEREEEDLNTLSTEEAVANAPETVEYEREELSDSECFSESEI